MPEQNVSGPSAVEGASSPRNITRANRQAKLGIILVLIGVALVSVILFPAGLWLLSQASTSLKEPEIGRVSPDFQQYLDQSFTPTPSPRQQAYQATLQSINSLTSTLMAQSAPVYGPMAGDLPHKSDYNISSHESGVALADFVAEATFYNPYDIKEGPWDFGFLFRSSATATNNEYRLIIRSDEEWMVELAQQLNQNQRPTFTEIESSWLPSHILDISASGSNHLRMIVTNNTVYIYLNHKFIGSADVSELQVGDVSVATALWEGDIIKGKSTHYTGFAIWPLSSSLARPPAD